MNIFVEGLQGMGKTTLLQKLSRKYPEYHVYHEGDYCPVELAWCTYMTQREYEEALSAYPTLKEEMTRRTYREGDRYIMEYTRILTDVPGFHRDMERFEIYNGRKNGEEFLNIIRRRYQNLPEGDGGYLYECAFFQNIISELTLWQLMPEEEIFSFYQELFRLVSAKPFLLYYLYDPEPEPHLRQICRERSDNEGNQLWYPLMMQYLAASPYGKKYGCSTFDDLLACLKRRQEQELRLIREILKDRAVILPAKRYTMQDLEWMEGK